MSAEEPAEPSPPPGPRRGPRPRAAIAAGVALVLLVVAAVLAVTLSGGGKHKAPVAAPTASPTPSPLPPPPSPSPTPVLQTFPYIVLKTGDCVSDPSLTQTLKRVVTHPCQDPHDGEVTGLVQLPGGLTTGLAISQKGRALCKPVNDAAWHRQPTTLADTLSEGFYFPDPAPYKTGNHTVTCVLEIGFRASKLHAPLLR